MAIGASYLPVGSCVRLDRLTTINANNGLFYGSIGAHLAKIRAILASPSVNDPATAASIDILTNQSEILIANIPKIGDGNCNIVIGFNAEITGKLNNDVIASGVINQAVRIQARKHKLCLCIAVASDISQRDNIRDRIFDANPFTAACLFDLVQTQEGKSQHCTRLALNALDGLKLGIGHVNAGQGNQSATAAGLSITLAQLVIML